MLTRCPELEAQKTPRPNSVSLKKHYVPMVEAQKRHPVQRHIPSTPRYGSAPPPAHPCDTVNVEGSFVYKMSFLGMTKWPRIGGWLLLSVGTHSRFYSLLYRQLYCHIHTLKSHILTLYADVEYNISTYNFSIRTHTVIYS